VNATNESLEPSAAHAPARRAFAVPIVLAGGTLAVAALVVGLVVHAASRTNKIALSDAAKAVSVVAARGASFRESRIYIGTLAPWVQANVGPQFVSAYVDTVLVRPGDVVKRGEVLATLDCRNAGAASLAIAAQARAVDARQKAYADEAARLQGMLDGGFVSPNEVEQKSAVSNAELAQLAAERSKLAASDLQVGDCVLRAPFDGEIGTRSIDPGAFVRPGIPIVSEVDRRTVRLVADAPEIDFDAIPPGTRVSVHIYALNKTLTASISRRAPSADPGTRTVHFEVDIADPSREIPVNTTGEVRVEVGEPVAATEIPLYGATVRGAKATIFTVDHDVAHARVFKVEGESEGNLFVDTALTPGTLVVTEGRALLDDGDTVRATLVPAPPSSTQPSPSPRGSTP
jgi:RND family efflux transporter MFP subunit